MITTNITADNHSLEIQRVHTNKKNEHVGYILWNRDHREPYIVFSAPFAYLTLTEIDAVLSAYKTKRGI